MNSALTPTAIRAQWRRPEVPAPPSFPPRGSPHAVSSGGRIIIKSARLEADSRGRARKERTELQERVTRN